MPVYTRETLKQERLPWVDIDDFEFLYFGRPQTAAAPTQAAGHTAIWGAAPRDVQERTIVPTSPKERLIALVGEVSVELEYGKVTLRRMEWIDIPPSGATVRNIANGSAEVLRLAGRWKEAIRTSIFQFRPDKPCEVHYHDGDEYWFVFRGHFTLSYDDREYPMGPGSMLAAGMGYEHGAPQTDELFEGVGFATQLEGRLRDGHLTRERHGDPVRNREIPTTA